MMKEISFKGSDLQNAMLQAKRTDVLYSWTKRAFEKQPYSSFWKDAFELISELHNKKVKKPH